MVSVAQLVERWIVAPVVVGSIPITHPNFEICSLPWDRRSAEKYFVLNAYHPFPDFALMPNHGLR